MNEALSKVKEALQLALDQTDRTVRCNDYAKIKDALAALSNLQQEPVPEVVRTAPERIWLQVSDDAAHKHLPFPHDIGAEITWCQDSVLDCEVEYVRADLTHPLAVAAEVDSASGRDAKDAEIGRLRRIAELIGAIYVYGNFKAETHNERELEKLLREQGTFFESIAEYEAAHFGKDAAND